MKCDVCGHINTPKLHLTRDGKASTWCGKSTFSNKTTIVAGEAECKSCLKHYNQWLQRVGEGTQER